MRHPVIVIYEQEGSLARTLRPSAEKNRWSLREARQTDACLRLIRQNSAAVLVIDASHDTESAPRHPAEAAAPDNPELERIFTLVGRVHWLCPGARVVVVCKRADVPLAGLAWDLGASFV